MADSLLPAQSGRIAWIDRARAIGIALVVLGHVHLCDVPGQAALRMIYAFHMPLFFFLSGLLDKRRSPAETFRRSLQQLLIPYALWYLLSYLWWFPVSFLRHPELFPRSFRYAFLRPMIGMLLGLGTETRFGFYVNAPLWFLPSLFCARMLSSLIRKGKPTLQALAILLFTALAVLLSQRRLLLPFSLSSALLCAPFYAAGICLQGKRLPLALWAKLPLAAGALALLWFSSRSNGGVDVNTALYGASPLLFYAGAFAGIAAISLACAALPGEPSRLVSFTARSTLTILAAHRIVTNLLEKLYAVLILHSSERIGDTSVWPLWQGLILTALVLALCLAAAQVVERFFPILAGSGRKKQR